MIALDSEISTIGGWNTVYATKGDPSPYAKILAQHHRHKG